MFSQEKSEQVLDENIQHLKKKIESNPHQVEYYYEIAELYKLKGDIGKYNSAYDKIMEIKMR